MQPRGAGCRCLQQGGFFCSCLGFAFLFYFLFFSILFFRCFLWYLFSSFFSFFFIFYSRVLVLRTSAILLVLALLSQAAF